MRDPSAKTFRDIQFYFSDQEDYYTNYDGEGSGFHDYPIYEDDYGPESEDRTEPPLFITDETDRYRKPTAPPRTVVDQQQHGDDFGFVDSSSDNVKDPYGFNNKIKNNLDSVTNQLNGNKKNAKQNSFQQPVQDAESKAVNLHVTSSAMLIALLLIFYV